MHFVLLQMPLECICLPIPVGNHAFREQFEYSQNTSRMHLDAEKMLTNHDICVTKLKIFTNYTVMKKSKILKNSQNVIKMSSKVLKKFSKVLKSLEKIKISQNFSKILKKVSKILKCTSKISQKCNSTVFFYHSN